MSNLKIFLKALEKTGYPKSSIPAYNVAKMVSYNIDNFMMDLIQEIGLNKTHEFVEKTFSSLDMMSDGIKIHFNESDYVYLIIDYFNLEPNDNEVWIHYQFGDSRLDSDNGAKTIEDIYDDMGLGEMSDYDEMMDYIRDECINQVYLKTGFQIHFDSHL